MSILTERQLDDLYKHGILGVRENIGMGDAIQTARALLAQRDALLAAAKKAVAWFPQDSEWSAPLHAAIAMAEQQ